MKLETFEMKFYGEEENPFYDHQSLLYFTLPSSSILSSLKASNFIQFFFYSSLPFSLVLFLVWLVIGRRDRDTKKKKNKRIEQHEHKITTIHKKIHDETTTILCSFTYSFLILQKKRALYTYEKPNHVKLKVYNE
jgi:hypothetical protein